MQHVLISQFRVYHRSSINVSRFLIFRHDRAAFVMSKFDRVNYGLLTPEQVCSARSICNGETHAFLNTFHASRDPSTGWQCHSAGAGGASSTRISARIKRVWAHVSRVSVWCCCAVMNNSRVTRLCVVWRSHEQPLRPGRLRRPRHAPECARLGAVAPALARRDY